MKARGLLVLVGFIALVAFACKKDIRPVVTYTVYDTTGAVLSNAHVYTHPCFDTTDCLNRTINTAFIKDGFTNGVGQVSFEYPYSAIIEVFGEWTDCDTAAGEWCMYTGGTVARFETKRAKAGEENTYSVRVIVRK